ncbi:MAG: sulfurtransferase [Candidatus Binatia bacterium]
MESGGYARPELLTSPDDLNQTLGDPSLCLIDTRPAEQFAQGHIPGSVHFDLFGLSLIDTSPAPLKAFNFMIQHIFDMRGVNQNKRVVFYEETSGMRAARGLWFLEFFGHPNVQVLDGGIQAWRQGGFPITTEVTPPVPSRLKVAEKEELLATADTVLGSLNQNESCILDTRSDDEYMGRNVRAARGGAIPGAIHIEWTRSLDERGRFKPASELKAMFLEAGVTPDKEIIAYCQGGYRSAHSYLALRLLGYPRVRNYLGSWKEWGDRLDLPIEKPWETR